MSSHNTLQRVQSFESNDRHTENPNVQAWILSIEERDFFLRDIVTSVQYVRNRYKCIAEKIVQALCLSYKVLKWNFYPTSSQLIVSLSPGSVTTVNWSLLSLTIISCRSFCFSLVSIRKVFLKLNCAFLPSWGFGRDGSVSNSSAE